MKTKTTREQLISLIVNRRSLIQKMDLRVKELQEANQKECLCPRMLSHYYIQGATVLICPYCGKRIQFGMRFVLDEGEDTKAFKREHRVRKISDGEKFYKIAILIENKLGVEFPKSARL